MWGPDWRLSRPKSGAEDEKRREERDGWKELAGDNARAADRLARENEALKVEVAELRADRDTLAHRRRWNVEEGEAGNVLACLHLHDKSEACEWIEYTPASKAAELADSLARHAARI